MPDNQQEIIQAFVAFCASQGHDDVTNLTPPMLRALTKTFNERRHLAAANRDAFGDNFPEE
jgi:hypothetical protein